MKTSDVYVGISLLAMLAVGVGGCPDPLAGRTLICDQGDYGDAGLLSDVAAMASALTADDIVLASGLSTIRALRWWGHHLGASTKSDFFVIEIYEDDGDGFPSDTPLYAIPVEVERRDTGDVTGASSGQKPIYEYTCEVASIPLDSGVTYHLAIVNHIGTWAWVMNGDGQSAQWSDHWATVPRDMAFQLFE